MEDNLVKTVELAVMRVMKFMILLEPLGNKYIRSHEKGNFIKNVISLGNVLFLFFRVVIQDEPQVRTYETSFMSGIRHL